ncbi:hypothetical protein [Tuberibacillus sp. Marseille-P3662]|uniref:hypothetical protein n=1 Tax=Tuberibacillus sp. Marseille-P3662 TaxID=1965358 RepID=UPI000A1C82C0|nr:hypothetical protein [Tuberibacillus sp. Marseille-P3662]
MSWSEISSFIIILCLAIGYFIQMREISALKKENARLLRKYNGYDDLKDEAKELLETSTEMKTIKTIRERYRLTMVDAKNIVDAVK